MGDYKSGVAEAGNIMGYSSCSKFYVAIILIAVGYMVGLGDRHVQNILIDTNTAEFIHIDLGMCVCQSH